MAKVDFVPEDRAAIRSALQDVADVLPSLRRKATIRYVKRIVEVHMHFPHVGNRYVVYWSDGHRTMHKDDDIERQMRTVLMESDSYLDDEDRATETAHWLSWHLYNVAPKRDVDTPNRKRRLTPAAAIRIMEYLCSEYLDDD